MLDVREVEKRPIGAAAQLWKGSITAGIAGHCGSMEVVHELSADCSRCAGLCCVALPFGRSSDFPVDKAAGDPCGHLSRDFRCGIHDRLREEGYRGCAAFDCFGAGQQVTQVTFGGEDWRSGGIAAQMFAVFGVMRRLHELLWHLDAAQTLPTSAPLSSDLESAALETVALTGMDAATLASYDVEPHRNEVNLLLRQASRLARQAAPGPELDGAALIGRDLRDTALVGSSLRGALLTGADLRGVDLTLADVTGADLRGADVSGAELTRTLFLSQAQVDSARGSGATELPTRLSRPTWWPTAQSS